MDESENTNRDSWEARDQRRDEIIYLHGQEIEAEEKVEEKPESDIDAMDDVDYEPDHERERKW